MPPVRQHLDRVGPGRVRVRREPAGAVRGELPQLVAPERLDLAHVVVILVDIIIAPVVLPSAAAMVGHVAAATAGGGPVPVLVAAVEARGLELLRLLVLLGMLLVERRRLRLLLGLRAPRNLRALEQAGRFRLNRTIRTVGAVRPGRVRALARERVQRRARRRPHATRGLHLLRRLRRLLPCARGRGQRRVRRSETLALAALGRAARATRVRLRTRPGPRRVGRGRVDRAARVLGEVDGRRVARLLCPCAAGRWRTQRCGGRGVAGVPGWRAGGGEGAGL